MIHGRHDVVLGGRFANATEVGRGGAGVVYHAEDRVTGLAVALKVIAIAGIDAGEEARFVREGRVLAGLRHPGIVRVVAFGHLDEGQPYVAMEWLDGEDLAKRHKRAPLTISEALDVAAQTADALHAAHEAGIVHRDVKPSNLFLVQNTAGELRVKLVDFGVAAAEDSTITRTGAIVGTPAYMAPEQARGDDEIDARADIYSLGATLFELCAGRPPHVGPTPIAVLARLVTTPAPHLREIVPYAPAALDDLLTCLLAQNADERPFTAAAVASRVRALSETLGTDGGDSGILLSGVPDSGPQSSGGPSSVGSQVLSLRVSAGGSRLVTTIVATAVPKGPPRQRIMAHLRARGAEATELGGDAVVAHLGVLRALGDEAAQAIDLGVRLGKLGARVGVATGRTRIDRARPTGEVVDRAAALARDAAREQVLTDTTTTELARGRFEFQMRADGTGVVGAQVASRKDAIGGAPLVGREPDLAQIVAGFERSAEDRCPIIATVTGSSGIGKSRLRRESVARIASHPSHPRILSARCESFAKTHSLGLAADLIRELLAVPRGASQLTISKAMEVFRQTVFVEEATTTTLTTMLAPDRDNGNLVLARDVVWIALTDFVSAAAELRPLALDCEDMQWADAESVAWLDHLLGRAAGMPLFVVLTMRPSFWREPTVRFQGRDHVRIELRPLSQRNIRAIAKAILGERGNGPEGEKLVDSIATQASGSPLFAEELSRLAAQGRDATSAATIEAAIQVHLDALDDADREAAAKLSVFGLTGWEAGLSHLGVIDAKTRLRNLAAAELLIEHASARFPNTREWAFKHALTREVAYASLGEDSVRECHRNAGDWLARVGEDDLVIAKHMDLGGVPERTAPYLEKAARRALAANSLGQAVELAERALAFAEDKPVAFARAQILDDAWSRLDARAGERETAVSALEDSVTDEASAVRASGARARYEDAGGGTAETTAKLEDVRLRARAAHLLDEEARVAAALAARLAFAGEFDRAEQVCAELLEMSKSGADPQAAVDAWQTLAVVRQTRGELGSALVARAEAVKAAHDAKLLSREATLLFNVGFALTTIGAKEEAKDSLQRGLSLAHALGAPGVVRHGQMNLLGWTSTFGSAEEFDRELEGARRLADDAVAGSWVPHDRGTLGFLFYRGAELLSRSERMQDARSLLKLAAEAYAATKMLDIVPVALGLWSEAERRLGNVDLALDIGHRAACMLNEGSPSLLNEAPVFLSLHDAHMDLGMLKEARADIEAGIPRLQKRFRALATATHARKFLTQLPANSALLAAAEAYGLLPDDVAGVLRSPAPS